MSFLLDTQNWKEQWENIIRGTLKSQVDGRQNSAFYTNKAFWRMPRGHVNKRAANISPYN